MATTVRTIGTDALTELGVLQPGEVLRPEDGALVLLRAQTMLDAWQADQLTFLRQLRTVFTLTSGTTAVSVGTGLTVNITRPMYVNAVNFIVPGTVPTVEVPIGLMDRDAFAALTIKQLSSALPLQAFYEPDVTGASGTLTFWPQVSQNVQIALYTPQGIDVPVTLDTVLVGPAGYADAFMYELAQRLATPYGQAVSPALVGNLARAKRMMVRPNVQAPVMGIDAALVPSMGAGYNILSDQMTSSQGR